MKLSHEIQLSGANGDRESSISLVIFPVQLIKNRTDNLTRWVSNLLNVRDDHTHPPRASARRGMLFVDCERTHLEEFLEIQGVTAYFEKTKAVRINNCWLTAI